MSKVGAFEAKTHLPRLLERVQRGERFVITKHGHPVAELIPYRQRDPDKIRSAIERAGRASGEFGAAEAERLSRQVVKVLTHRSPRREPPGIEQIQDLVEGLSVGANDYLVKVAGDALADEELRASIVQDDAYTLGRPRA